MIREVNRLETSDRGRTARCDDVENASKNVSPSMDMEAKPRKVSNLVNVIV